MSDFLPPLDPPPPINGESVPPGEAATIARTVSLVEEKVREAAARSGSAMRDAHPKGHGVVQASFDILPNLPKELSVGLFAEPKHYDAWIRFSNGSPKVQADNNGDARGMAIKSMNVEGSRSTTHDFIMINHPVFAARNVADYLELEAADPTWKFFVPGFNPLHFRVHEALIAFAILHKKATSLLNIQYWSMSAYRFGDSACKFSARPTGTPSPFNDTTGDDFLRVNLARHLSQQSATFDFMVQRRTKPDAMPVEDPTIEWNESDSPFVPVARITIPRQTFDTPDQMKFCENLSFAPWHCTDAHRPLGGLNRLRREVYEAISRLRHGLNKVPPKEPTDFSIT